MSSFGKTSVPDTNDEVMDIPERDRAFQEMDSVQRYRTVDSVTIPKEVFEAIYAPSKGNPRSVLRSTFGNPFPMPLMGFLIASTPLGCTLMGWRGAGGQGAALIGVFYFFGGMLQIIGAVMEWIIGNTFPFVVFASYGAFWLSLGATLQPDYNALGAYVQSGTSSGAQDAGTAIYYNTYGFFYMIMTVLTFFYLLASIRTNLVLLLVFLFIDLAFFMLMSSYWTLAEGETEVANQLQIAGGAFIFVFCMFGWYLFFALILVSLDFPFALPLGDLSKRFPSGASKKEKRENGEV